MLEKTPVCPDYSVWDVRINGMPEAREIKYKQIVECEPFCLKNGVETTTIIDLDGFFLHGGSENNLKDNLKRLMALRSVIANSSKVIFWSSRIELDEESVWGKLLLPIFEGKSITCFPFFSDSSRERLIQFAEKANPDCRVDFRIGLGKTVGCGDINFRQEVVEEVRSGNEVAILGSSFKERKFAKEVAEILIKYGLDPKKLHLFDSGKWFL